MKESFVDKYQIKIFWFTWGLIIACCIFIFFSNTVHAASTSGSLPYTVTDIDSYVNEDGYTLGNLQDFYDGRWGQTYPLDFSQEGVVIFEYDEFINDFWGTVHYTNVIVPNDSSSFISFESWSTIYDLFNYETDSVTMQCNKYSSVSFSTYRNQYNDPSLNVYNGDFSTGLFHNANKYPVYVKGKIYNNTRIFDTQIHAYINVPGDKVVLQNGNAPLVITGHSVAPDFDDTGHSINGAPSNVPSHPTISHHVPSVWNPPTIDTTNVETLLESIFDLLNYSFDYFKNDLNGKLQTLLSNLSAWFDYLGETLLYIGKKIIANIQTGFTNLYENIASLFEPLLNGIVTLLLNIYNSITDFFTMIQDRIDYANEPIDYNRIETYYQDTKVYELEDSVSTFCDAFVDTVSNVVPPQRLEFSVDFSNGPWPFNLCGRMYFNFDFYENIRHTIVPWILAFMYVGVVLSLIQQIPNILHGIAGLGFSTQQAHLEHMNNAEWFGYNWTHSFDGSGYIGMGGAGVPSTYRNVNGWYGNWREV